MTVAAIVCPTCSALMQTTARFCPGCGEPRTAVRLEIEQAATATGVPYERLLEQARSSTTAYVGTATATTETSVTPTIARKRLNEPAKYVVTGAVIAVIAAIAIATSTASALILVVPVVVFVFIKYL